MGGGYEEGVYKEGIRGGRVRGARVRKGIYLQSSASLETREYPKIAKTPDIQCLYRVKGSLWLGIHLAIEASSSQVGCFLLQLLAKNCRSAAIHVLQGIKCGCIVALARHAFITDAAEKATCVLHAIGALTRRRFLANGCHRASRIHSKKLESKTQSGEALRTLV